MCRIWDVKAEIKLGSKLLVAEEHWWRWWSTCLTKSNTYAYQHPLHDPKQTDGDVDLCESRWEWLPETESGEETDPRPDFCFACVRMWDFRFVDCANFLLQPWTNNDIIKPISPLQHDKNSQPQRDRRKGDLQCECARAFSSWSRERIFFRSPQMCTGTVFLPCEPTGGASACCSRRKLFHIRRKHVPWGRDRSYLLRSMWCHHVVVLTIMSWWWWFDHIVNHFFLSFNTWVRVCGGVFSWRCCLETSAGCFWS